MNGKEKLIYNGNLENKIKIKLNDFTYIFCRKDKVENAKKKYKKYFNKKFINY